ncbi:hypothetical protein U9M48_034385 [Paspalum notatum var. saurae]|uniref:Uncharacterized protein n=1 Tax=Paspalum notatum var. saurae TaxID=547442 RepID=A0AAQ3UC43_PASNO
MQPRPRIRGRDPHPPPSSGGGGGGGGGTGGRYRRRSRSPRRPQRRSPERGPPPRRYGDGPPLPDVSAAAAASILLEAGRLAAHYLVAQGVLPDHVLRAREDPTFPAAGHGYGTEALLDDADDPRSRSRRNAGDRDRTRPRPRDDDDCQPRRSRWDRRSHSFDGSRKYQDAGDADRGGRRTPRDYDEPRRPAVSRSYSHNERRPSDRRPPADDRLDPSRRSRSRSRTYYAGSRRDSHCSRDVDGTAHPRVPSSVVVAEANGTAHQATPTQEEGEIPVLGRNHTPDISEDEDAQFAAAPLNGGDGVEVKMDVAQHIGEREILVLGQNHTRDISEDDDAEFAAAHLNGGDGVEVEMDVAQHIGEREILVLRQDHTRDISEDEDAEFAAARLNGGDGVEIEMDVSDANAHLSDPVHRQSHLSNAVEDLEAGDVPMDVCTIETLGEDNGSSQARDDEMEAPPPQRQVETGSGDLNRDEQDLPAWYEIFDLNVVETPEVCEMTEIPGDPPGDHVSGSVPDSVGQVHHKTNYGASESQGQDVRAGDNCLFGDSHDLNNKTDEHVHAYTSEIQDEYASESQDEGEHARDGHCLNKYDLNNEAIEHAQDSQLLDNGELLLNDGRDSYDTDRCHLNNEQMLLYNNADEQEQRNHWVQIDPVSGEQLMLSHDADGYPVSNHEMESVPKHLPMGVHDLHSYNLKSEQTLLNDGTDKHAPDSCHLKNEQMLFDQSADGQARDRDTTNERMIPMINVEDDDKEQSDTREFLEFKRVPRASATN